MKFYIGQRVRIVAVGTCPELMGKEATVVSELAECECSITGKTFMGYDIDVDGFGVGPNDNEVFCSPPEDLEPIQPSGWKKITWKEMEDLWSPPALTPSDAMT